jgi:hypothetical protein
MSSTPPCRARDAPSSLIVAWALLPIVASLSGCDDGQPSSEERLASELASQLQAEHRDHRNDVARHEIQLADEQADRRAITLIWASTAAALFALVLLLARERRARRVLERLLKLLLNRSTGTRGPP